MRNQSVRALPLLIAAVAAVSFAGRAFAAYQVTAIIPLPYTSTDGTAAATPANYTSVSLTSLPRATSPNGGSGPLLVGTLSGKKLTDSTVSYQTAFAYDPTIGFRLIGKYTTTSTGAHASANVRAANSAGQVIGSSTIYSSLTSDSNIQFGSDAWLYTTAGNTNISLGLTGPNFSYSKSVPSNAPTTPSAFAAPFSNSTPSFINNAGMVVGTTSRYSGDTTAPSTGLGTSAFLYTPGLPAGTTTEIGLYGSTSAGLLGNTSGSSAYSYNVNTGTTSARFSSNGVLGLTDSGFITGNATPYLGGGSAVVSAGGSITGAATSLGQDAWVSNGTSTTPIGLYQRGINPVIEGYESAGFRYFGLTTGGIIGTSASDQTRSTTLTALNATGQVIGTSSYYTAIVSSSNGGASRGTDAFVYSSASPSADKYRQLGFTKNNFLNSDGTANASPTPGTSSYVFTFGGNAGIRSTTPRYINAAGKIAGVSALYSAYQNGAAVSQNTGAAAWIDSGTGPTRIGLYGQAGDANASKHTNPQTFATNSDVTNLTESGFVGGYSSRYYLASTGTGTQFGQDAWVYNPNTGLTSIVAPVETLDSTSNGGLGVYASTQINYLSEDGYAVGFYQTSTSLSSTGLTKAFLWSLTGGFVDLGTNISPTLLASGYQNLINAYYDSTGATSIYATASNTVSTTVGGLVLLTPAVPEPSSFAAIAVGGAALLRRRRRLM